MCALCPAELGFHLPLLASLSVQWRENIPDFTLGKRENTHKTLYLTLSKEQPLLLLFFVPKYYRLQSQVSLSTRLPHLVKSS